MSKMPRVSSEEYEGSGEISVLAENQLRKIQRPRGNDVSMPRDVEKVLLVCYLVGGTCSSTYNVWI